MLNYSGRTLLKLSCPRFSLKKHFSSSIATNLYHPKRTFRLSTEESLILLRDVDGYEFMKTPPPQSAQNSCIAPAANKLVSLLDCSLRI